MDGVFMIFAKGKTIKGTNSLTLMREERSKRKGHAQTYKHLDFQPHNPLKFKLKVRVKT
jgi:hypothetical protein